MTKPKFENRTRVWSAITDTPEQAADLRLRAELMDKITALIQVKGWTQAEAAKHCSVTQPSFNELLRRRISRFTLDALVNITVHLGQRAHVEMEAA